VKLYRANSKQITDTHGMSRILEMLAEVMPDVVILLNDPHVLSSLLFKNRWDPEHILLRLRPLVTYQAVDGENVPAAWKTAIMPNTIRGQRIGCGGAGRERTKLKISC